MTTNLQAPGPRHGRARRRGWSVLAVVSVVAIGGGLAAAGWVAWELVGTTAVAAAAARDEVADFYARVEPPGPGIARLRTDLVADPPPEISLPASGTWGTLIVPSWAGATGPYGEDLSTRIPLAEGTTDAVLDRAWAGHVPGTAGPGEVGNLAVAAHRRSRGQSFARLDELAAGDAVVIETEQAWFVYRVTGEPEVVTPDAVDEVAPVPHVPDQAPTRRLVTLTTCTSTTLGQWGNDHRLAVHTELAGWAPRAEGIPEELTTEGVS